VSQCRASHLLATELATHHAPHMYLLVPEDETQKIFCASQNDAPQNDAPPKECNASDDFMLRSWTKNNEGTAVVVLFIQEESQDCGAWKPGRLWSIGTNGGKTPKRRITWIYSG
jgi:hypothetical protein